MLPRHWRAAERMARPGPQAAVGEGGPVVWMHAASFGESRGLWALAETLLEGAAGRLLLTSGSASGADFLAARAEAWRMRTGRESLRVSMAPLDHPGHVARFLSRHEVACLVLYEVELWPNYVLASSRRGIPILLVSARLSSRARARLGLLPGPWRVLLDRMDWIQAQDRPDAERLRTLTRVRVDTGFDYKAAYYLRNRPAGGKGPREDRIAFVSLHLPELRRLLPALPGLMRRSALHVFPRLPQEMEAFRRILLPMGFVLHGADPAGRHVLVDFLGKVGEILPRCRAAFVGGSLIDMGCHNLWEPLLAGTKACFGPSVFNQEGVARDMLALGLADRVDRPEDLLALRPPEPGLPAAARAYADSRFRELEAAEAAVRRRLAAVLPRFYLFSGP